MNDQNEKELDLEQLSHVKGGVGFQEGLEEFMKSGIPYGDKRRKLEELKEEIETQKKNKIEETKSSRTK